MSEEKKKSEREKRWNLNLPMGAKPLVDDVENYSVYIGAALQARDAQLGRAIDVLSLEGIGVAELDRLVETHNHASGDDPTSRNLTVAEAVGIVAEERAMGRTISVEPCEVGS